MATEDGKNARCRGAGTHGRQSAGGQHDNSEAIGNNWEGSKADKNISKTIAYLHSYFSGYILY